MAMSHEDTLTIAQLIPVSKGGSTAGHNTPLNHRIILLTRLYENVPENANHA